MPAGPAVTEPRSIFLHPQTERHARECVCVRVCVYSQKHINTHEIFYMCKHTHLVLGAKNYKIGDEVLCETVCVCVCASLYSTRVCQAEILC